MAGTNLSNKGFSLIEIVLASTISVILIVPLMLLYQQSLNETQQSFDEIQAMLLAREVVDEFNNLKTCVSFESLTMLASFSTKDTWIDLSQLPHTKPLLRGLNVSNEVRSLSTFNLSPLPSNYQRMVQIKPANIGSGTQEYVPYMPLLSLDIIIGWKTLRSDKYNRSIKLRSLIALDNIKPEF